MNTLTVFALVTIRLYDIYGLPPATVRQAVDVSASTLRQAGVTSRWLECSKPDDTRHCDKTLERGEVLVRIHHGPSDGAVHVLGSALVDRAAREGTVATVYADRVMALAALAATDVGTVLGRAIAHELGHLLLGTSDHAATGLMRARWTVDELRRPCPCHWTFSAADADRLQHRPSRSLAASLRGQGARE